MDIGDIKGGVWCHGASCVLSCMHTHETYQVSLDQSAFHNRFWTTEAIMDLAFWEIPVFFFVMQMKACHF